MKAFALFVIACLTQGLFAQSIHATWTTESKEGEPVILVLLPDASFLVKFGADDPEAMFGPFFGEGTYAFEEDKLSLNMSTGESYVYGISDLSQEGFEMHREGTGEGWTYHYQGPAKLPEWAQSHLQLEGAGRK